MSKKELSGYAKRFIKKFGSKAVSMDNISHFVRGLKIKDADKILRPLSVELGLIPKRDRFTAVKKPGGLYRVEYRKMGVTMIHNNCTKIEVEMHHKRFKLKLEQSEEPISHKVRIKKSEREIDVVNYFYDEVLADNDFYLLGDFDVALYDGERDVQLWIPVSQKIYKQKLQLVKFFISRKRIDLGENKNVMFTASKRIKGGYYLTGVMPNVHFYNNRVGFYAPIVGKEISLETSFRLWPKARKEFAYNNQKIMLSDIPKEKAHKFKHDKKSDRVAKNELREIMKLEATALSPVVSEQKLIMRIHLSKWYRTCRKYQMIQAGQGIRIDKSLRKERKEQEIQKILNQRR